MDKIWDRKSFEVRGHWPLWRGRKNRMTTQNRQKSNAKKNIKYWVPFNDITLTAQQHPLFYTVWWTPIPPSQLYVPASGHWQEGRHTKLMTWHQPMYTPSKLTPIYTSSNTKLYNGTCLYCAMVFDAWTFSMSSLENNKKWQQHCDRTNW